MNGAILETELDGLRENISLDYNGGIRANVEVNCEYTRDNLTPVQSSKNSTVPIGESHISTSSRIASESPERHLQNQDSSEQFQADATSGESSPHLGEYITTISSSLDARVVDEKYRAKVAGAHARKEQSQDGASSNLSFGITNNEAQLHSGVNEQNKKNAKSVRQEQQQQVPNSIDNNNTHSDKGKQVVGSDTAHKQNDEIIPPPQHNFPRVSNNLGRYVPKTQWGNNMLPQDRSHNVQTVANSQNNAKKDSGDPNPSQGNARNNEAEGNGSTLQQNQITNSNLQAHETGQIHGISGYTVVEGMNGNLQHSQKFKNNNLEDNATPSGKQEREVTLCMTIPGVTKDQKMLGFGKGSNHCPLLLEMGIRSDQDIKYFKFLHFWVENKSFLDTVKRCWERDASGDPMWTLHQKMKRLASTLSNWSRREFGDVFAIVRDYEDQVQTAEAEVMTNNTENQVLQEMPTLEELREVIFSMNPNSAPGPMSGFVKGRSISENIMLAQEITYDIKNPVEGDNVIIKLNMAKAYGKATVLFGGMIGWVKVLLLNTAPLFPASTTFQFLTFLREDSGMKA
ncbi:hypothetical protein MTR67_042996 [Solanum verrucosum]|uniref:Uncharacterized protein n=1 Tax=Solanum verrucosum TaxID=315347 RepID=A0AAF0UQH6_SOLVR|nr:hypothetical protein MTR67_042996 [Solanum verrucosum]